MKIIGKRNLLLVLLFATLSPVWGQFTYNSPYSRFGIGDLYQGSNALNGSMGGLKYGINSGYLVNPSNPASYTSFKKNYFTFDVGLSGSSARLTSGDKVRDEGQFNLSNISFGIPLGEKWGAAVGLVPFSSVGYKITDADYNDDFGGYSSIYEGEGGLNKVFGGVARKITKNLSVGVNANFYFGSLNYLQTVTFDSINFLNLRSEKSRIIHDFSFDAGLLYEQPLNETRGLYLTGGISAGFPAALGGREDILTETFKYSGSGVVVIRDTVTYVKGEKGDISMPLHLAGGLSLRRNDRWLVGVDFSWQDWSGFEAFGVKDSLSPSMQMALGGEYKLNKILLRAGVRYHQSYLQIRDNQLSETAVSFGIGWPVYNKNYSVSMISAGVEAGSRGTTDDGLIHENFGRVWLSFTMNQERWFKRREYL